MQKNNKEQKFLHVCKQLGRLPSWSEYLHLADQWHESESGKVTPSDMKVIYCDVTQYLKQVKITGIQRVVKAFDGLEIPNFRLVYFNEGNYYFFNGEKGNSDRNWTYFITKLEQYIKKKILIVGFVIWSKSLSKIVQKKKDTRNFFTIILKSFRNKLLPKSTDQNILNVSDLLNGQLFVPDLPADRAHLEALLVLTSERLLHVDFFVHDLIPLTHPELMPRNSTNEFNLYLKVISSASRIFCSSVIVSRDIERMLAIFRSKADDLPDIIVHSFPIVPSERELLTLSRNEQQILDRIRNSEKPFVFAVGTILARKNYSLVVRALDKLRESDGECQLIIFAHHNWGDDAFKLLMQSELRSFVVIVEGASDQLISMVSETAISMVYPSLVEGFGLPISEAISNGSKVIVNDVEPMNTFAEVSDLVYLAAANSSEDWARVISTLINSERSFEKRGNFTPQTWESWAREFVKVKLTEDFSR